MALRALALAAAAVAAAAQTLPPASNLVVEYVADPIVLDVPAPRFSWTVSAADPAARGVVQGSYRVQVTYRAPGGGAAAQMWDSGVVASAQTTNVAYAGTALFPDSLFSWTVVWTDGAGNSAPAANGTFGTGLLTQAAWAPAAWIGCPLRTAGGPNFNQLRAEFDLAAPAGVTVVQARAYIAAVGYYSLRVNGAWASQGAGRPRPILDPGWTTYEVTSLYNAYDVTDALVPSGPNAFAIHLGNGWPDIDPVPGNSSALAAAAATGAPDADALVAARLAGALTTRSADGNSGASRQARMVVSVRTSDGKTTTWTTTAASFAAGARGGAARAAAGGWQCGAGALLFDNIYDGCTYDARLETTGWDSPGYTYSSGTWTPALLRADPGGAKPTTMLAQLAPAIVAVAELPARAMWSPAPGVYVFDFEQNLSGYLRLCVPPSILSSRALRRRGRPAPPPLHQSTTISTTTTLHAPHSLSPLAPNPPSPVRVAAASRRPCRAGSTSRCGTPSRCSTRRTAPRTATSTTATCAPPRRRTCIRRRARRARRARSLSRCSRTTASATRSSRGCPLRRSSTR